MYTGKQSYMPHKLMMSFDHWRIYSNRLYLYFTYVSSTPTGLNGGLVPQSRTRFRFEAPARGVTSPIAFDPGVWIKLDGFFVIVPPSLPASAEIIFDPDNPPVTWGGPTITLRLSIPDNFDEFDFEVKLPAYTDPVALGGKVVRL